MATLLCRVEMHTFQLIINFVRFSPSVSLCYLLVNYTMNHPFTPMWRINVSQSIPQIHVAHIRVTALEKSVTKATRV